MTNPLILSNVSSPRNTIFNSTGGVRSTGRPWVIPPNPILQDPIRPLLSNGTTITNWSAAPSGSWVRVTRAEYGQITASLTGAAIKGHNNTIINTRLSSTTFADRPITFNQSGSVSQPLFTLNSGEYLVAFIAETWNTSSTTFLGYTTQLATGSPEFIVTGAIQFGGDRTYFARKAPDFVSGAFYPVTGTLFPVVNYTQSPNGASSSMGLGYSSSFSSPPVWVNNTPTPKIQVVVTTTAPWTP